MSPLLRSEAESYYLLGSVSDAETEGAVVVTRADAGELNEGLTAFSGGRYREAIEPLSTYVRQNPDSPDVAYARFLLGLSYLSVARSDFLGRAHRVDADLVGRAIEQLEEAAQTSDIERIREDALWFLAKGHLLDLDSQSALEVLQRIERINGRRASDARALAAEIHALADASP